MRKLFAFCLSLTGCLFCVAVKAQSDTTHKEIVIDNSHDAYAGHLLIARVPDSYNGHLLVKKPTRKHRHLLIAPPPDTSPERTPQHLMPQLQVPGRKEPQLRVPPLRAPQPKLIHREEYHSLKVAD